MPFKRVFIFVGEGFFLIPHRTRRWRLGLSKMMRRSGLSCSGKDVSVIILSSVRAVPLSLRILNMAGYTAKELASSWLSHISAKVEADLGGPIPCGTSGGRGRGDAGGLVTPSIVCPGSTNGNYPFYITTK